MVCISEDIDMKIILTLVAIVGLVFAAGCEEGAPVVNGKNVLTVEQYNKLMASMQHNSENGNGAQAQLTAMEEGSRLYRLGQYSKAASVFQGIIGSEPENSRAWFMLGNSYEKGGQLEQAQSAYKTSYDLMVKKGYIPDASGVM